MATRRLPDDLNMRVGGVPNHEVLAASDHLRYESDLTLARSLGRDLQLAPGYVVDSDFADDFGYVVRSDLTIASDLGRDIPLVPAYNLGYAHRGDGRGDGFGDGRGDGFGDGRGDGFGDGRGDGFGDLAGQARKALRPARYDQLTVYSETYMSGTKGDIGELYFGLLVYYVWYPMCVAWAISEEKPEVEPSSGSNSTSEPPPEAIAEIASIALNTEPSFEERSAIRRTVETVLTQVQNSYQNGAWGRVPHIEEDVRQTMAALTQALNPPNPERDFSLPIVNGHTILLTQWLTDLQPESDTKTLLAAALQTATIAEAQPDGDLDDIIEIAENLVPHISPDPPEWLDDQEGWDALKQAATNDPKSYVAWSLGWFTPVGTDLAFQIHLLEDRWNRFSETVIHKANKLADAEPAIRAATSAAHHMGGVGARMGASGGLLAGLGVAFTTNNSMVTTTSFATAAGGATGGLGAVTVSFLLTWLSVRFKPGCEEDDSAEVNS